MVAGQAPLLLENADMHAISCVQSMLFALSNHWNATSRLRQARRENDPVESIATGLQPQLWDFSVMNAPEHDACSAFVESEIRSTMPIAESPEQEQSVPVLASWTPKLSQLNDWGVSRRHRVAMSAPRWVQPMHPDAALVGMVFSGNSFRSAEPRAVESPLPSQ